MRTTLLIILLASAVSAEQMASTIPNCRGMWHFGEGTGTVAEDATILKKNFALTDSAWITGRIGWGIFFNGSSDSVGAYTITSEAASTDFSLVAWLYRTASCSAYCTIFENHNATIDEPKGYINPAGKLMLYNVPNGINPQSTSIVPIGAWTHVVITTDGSNIRFYINGKYDNFYASTQKYTLTSSRVGLGYGGNQGYFGYVDDLAIFNSTLSPGQISKIYNATLGRHSNAR